MATGNPDKALRNELFDHQDQEVAQQLRDEQIAEYAAGLLLKGNDCHPWTQEHFEEAIGNVSYVLKVMLFTYMDDAVKDHLANGRKNRDMLVVLKTMVETYWQQVAIAKAEEYYAKKWD